MKKPDTRKAPMSAVSDYIEMLEKKIIELNNELEKYRKGHLAPEILPVGAVNVDSVHRVIETKVEKSEIE